jgi:hypothetical protein
MSLKTQIEVKRKEADVVDIQEVSFQNKEQTKRPVLNSRN